MGVPNHLWILSPVNRDYKVSDTYPAELYVPKSATHPVIVGSSKFRSRGRFPTLSYYCKENHVSLDRSLKTTGHVYFYILSLIYIYIYILYINT
ncbi:unnamed protein product [Oncorhynchus mykiss]|uniref:Myotubularin phosphatase domain-containing protein n=1 Tax=Oncorhynchus mykiss TaxID=8022 RepID=A0A060XBK4_ONCMY|nr:unnamed protein product [Oncorhynchus mykiss]